MAGAGEAGLFATQSSNWADDVEEDEELERGEWGGGGLAALWPPP